MKRSSIVLIAALGILILGAFIAPYIILKKNPVEKKNITLSLANTSTIVPINESFSSFKTFISDSDFYLGREDYSRSLNMEIIVCDAIKQPYFECDKSWAENIGYVVNDSILTLNIDMHSLISDADLSDLNVFIPIDNEQVGRLYLPAGHNLSSLESPSIKLDLSNFKGLYTSIHHNTEYTLSNSTVTLLTFGSLPNP